MNNEDAAETNSLLIEKVNYDLEALIESQTNSTLSYGSEFRTTQILENLFRFHENWKRIRYILEKGTDTALVELKETDKKVDLNHNMKIGNDKFTMKSKEHVKFFIKKITQEVEKGQDSKDEI